MVKFRRKVYISPVDPIALGQLAVWQEKTKGACARVLLIHGMSEHSARHSNTIHYLNQKGLEVVRFDLRGSGRSGGLRQWVEKFEDYVEDTAQVLNWIETSLSPLPLFVLGHSMGGAIGIYFTSHYQKRIRGLVLSAPAYKVGGAISPLKIKVGNFLSQLAPKLRIPGADDKDCVSKDKEVVKAYAEDPLCFHYNTLQQGSEVLRALERIPDICSKIEVPILIAHGTHDRLIRPEGSYDILRSLKSPDRWLAYLPNGYHEPHNDTEKEEYFALISGWILKHLPG